MNGHETDPSNPHATPSQPPSAPQGGLTTEPAGGSSLDAERDLLGRLLTDPDNAATANRTVLVCQEIGLRAEDFYHAENRPIFTAEMNLAERGISGGIAEVETELLAMGRLDAVGGSHALRSLARRITSDSRAPMDLAREIANKSTARRSADELAQTWRDVQFGTGDAAATVRESIERLGGIASRKQEPTRLRSMDDLFSPAATRMISLRERSALHASIIPTGIPELDYRGGGLLRRGKLTVIVGKSGIGKTTHALHLCIHAGTSPGDRQFVTIYFLEGQLEDLTQRMIELRAGKDHSTSNEVDAWRQASADLDAGRFFYDAGGRRAVEAICAAGPSFAERGVKLVVVDSFERLDAAGASTNDDFSWSYTLNALKTLAQTYNVAVLINRVIGADTLDEARDCLKDSEGKIDIAALLSRIPSGPGGERRKLSVFHNRNGQLVDVFMEIAADRRFGAILPIDRPPGM